MNKILGLIVVIAPIMWVLSLPSPTFENIAVMFIGLAVGLAIASK